MSIKINLPSGMLKFTGNRSIVEVEGKTVGECVEQLIARYPEVRASLLDAGGKVLDYVDIFVNGVSSFPQELAMPVKDGDEMHILQVFAGG